MAALTFGQDAPPKDPGEPMAYIARGRECGHIVVLVHDRGGKSVDDFVNRGVIGHSLERIPLAEAKGEFGPRCPKCIPPEQLGLTLV